MELYINSSWTERYAGACIAHATIYTTGITAEEADAKLMGALRELKLVPDATSTKVEPTA
jgi:hypothetical protein